MVPLMALLMLIASTDEAVAAKLLEIRHLPPLVASRAMLALIEEHELKSRAAFDIAKEAYEVAIAGDSLVDPLDYPETLSIFGTTKGAIAEARLRGNHPHRLRKFAYN